MAASSETYRKAASGLDALQRSLAKRRSSQFSRTRAIDDAVFKNLGNDLRSTRAQLSSGNQRIIDQVRALVARQAKSGAAVGRAKADVSFAGVGDYAANAFKGAEASAKGGQMVAGAGLDEIKFGAQTSQGLMDILGQGTQQAKAGADYAVGQALAARTKEDVAQVAEQRQQLLMAQLQQQYALEQMDHQVELANQAATKQQAVLNAQAGPQAVALARHLAMVADYARKYTQEHAEDENLSPQVVAQAVISQAGITDDTGVALAQSLIAMMMAGGNQNALALINQLVREQYPQLHTKYGKQWSATAQATLAQYAMASIRDDAQNKAQAGVPPEGPGFWNDVASFFTPWNRG
jgi:hypothetical protein